jgi:sigma-B regulation protein RsbU (phosphoserine phosphatase)
VAGHNRPLWLRAESAVCAELAGQGIVLGIFEDIKLEEREVNLAPGDLVVFYTDGVTEAMDADQFLFGEDRLRAVVIANPQTTAQQLLQAIVDAVQAFTGNAPQSDDLTLFVIKRL